MNPLEAEVCVVGAGPAGCLLAGLLARAGCDVLLVGPGRSAPPSRLQSLAPGAMELLASEGIDLHGVWQRVPIEVRWPTATPLADPAIAAQSTIVVDRSAFDTALLAWAAIGGARVLDSRVEKAPLRNGAGSWTVEAPARAVRAANVVNAAGARSVLGSKRKRLGPRLFGLSTEIDIAGGRSGVWVEATSLGWLWAASMGDSRLTVLTTHHVAPPLREAPDALCSLLAESSLADLTGDRLRDLDELKPTDLTATNAAVGDHLAVGDAALTIDPLAGQGLAVALRSSAQAADLLLDGTAIVRTAQEVGRTHSQLAAAYYREAAAHFSSPFWTSRAR